MLLNAQLVAEGASYLYPYLVTFLAMFTGDGIFSLHYNELRSSRCPCVDQWRDREEGYLIHSILAIVPIPEPSPFLLWDSA